MFNNKKMLYALIILAIIIIGIIVICVKDVNYGLRYGKNATIEMNLENDFELSDIGSIVKETFGDYNIRLLDGSDKDILITINSVSDEQIDSLISKLNEKYGIELSKNDLKIESNGQASLIDMINQYLSPVIIVSVIILIYFAIRYRKYDIKKVILYTIITIIGCQAIYFSIFAITRIPVNEFTMPISMIVLILSIFGVGEFFKRNNNI